MVQRLVPALSRGDGYLQVVLNLILPDKIIKTPRSKAAVEVYILGSGLTGNNSVYFNPP
jgi:hypothetical protein